ncbi:MAG: tetratricopeptide repeat protein, partial [Acidobacteria bacterium]|nr:tetratricopeptide repeat protein [Acidobacteriota bacterium]
IRYAPRDPAIHWQRGGVYFFAASEEQVESRIVTARNELRQATELSPEDYRVWLSLGRVLDRSGSREEARAALERALKLAPNHFETHWTMGNHLLRAGDRQASFTHLQAALNSRPSALPIIFNYAWTAFDGDGKEIIKALSPPRELNAQLVSLLILHGKIDDALALWREQNAPTVKDTQKVIESLINVGRYRTAFEIWTSSGILDRPGPDGDSLLANGNFEQNLLVNSSIPFYSWRIAPLVGDVRLTPDRTKPHEGERCLRASFNIDMNKAIILATQVVPVKPKTKYCLSFFAKTEDLLSLETPYVEIFDSANQKRASAESERFKIRSNEWREYEIELETAAETEALTVRLLRLPCPEPPCPIEGRVWVDGFRLNECKEGLRNKRK